MEIEITEQLKITLEKEMKNRFAIFEELTGLKIADVNVSRVLDGDSDITDLTVKVEME